MRILQVFGVAAMALVLLVISRPQPVATAPFAQESNPRVITVMGDDEVKAAPDKASVYLGVQSQGATADEAMRKNNELMGAVMAAIRSAGIPEQDIQTVVEPLAHPRPHATVPGDWLSGAQQRLGHHQ